MDLPKSMFGFDGCQLSWLMLRWWSDFLTVAILVQGTIGAVAMSQVFSNPVRSFASDLQCPDVATKRTAYATELSLQNKMMRFIHRARAPFNNSQNFPAMAGAACRMSLEVVSFLFRTQPNPYAPRSPQCCFGCMIGGCKDTSQIDAACI